MPEASQREIVISLISHTNVGKTALARTLLRRDVGEVADSAHVTVVPESWPLIESGDRRARLWDTPGFGSNLAKLAQRLRQSSNPIGWILHQIWDRAADKSLWCSQEAIRTVQNEADLVLYLVDASQTPEETGYIDLEIEVIEWIGKPVLVFLNQTGEPDPERLRRYESEWRDRLAKHAIVKRVSTLDAFTRCWVQEHGIFAQAVEVLSGEKRETARLLAEAWSSRQLDLFDQSIEAMAQLALAALTDTEALPGQGWVGRFRLLLQKNERNRELERIQKAMYDRLSSRTTATINRLISLHGLSGETAASLAEDSIRNLEAKADIDESLAAVLGGLGAGLIGGIAADLAAGGLSLGGGAIVGMLLGGGTTYALAKGYNLSQTGRNRVRWSEAHFREQVKSILLLYLAVAHFGRGRGAWRDPVNNPARWQELIKKEIDEQKSAWNRLWKRAGSSGETSLETDLARELRSTLVRVLVELYPESRPMFERSGILSRAMAQRGRNLS